MLNIDTWQYVFDKWGFAINIIFRIFKLKLKNYLKITRNLNKNGSNKNNKTEQIIICYSLLYYYALRLV